MDIRVKDKAVEITIKGKPEYTNVDYPVCKQGLSRSLARSKRQASSQADKTLAKKKNLITHTRTKWTCQLGMPCSVGPRYYRR